MVKRALHYQIDLIRLIDIITRFLNQNRLMDKSDESNYLYV